MEWSISSRLPALAYLRQRPLSRFPLLQMCGLHSVTFGKFTYSYLLALLATDSHPLNNLLGKHHFLRMRNDCLLAVQVGRNFAELFVTVGGGGYSYPSTQTGQAWQASSNCTHLSSVHLRAASSMRWKLTLRGQGPLVPPWITSS